MLFRSQGRMNVEVAAFPNRAFYGGLLQPVGLEHQTGDVYKRQHLTRPSRIAAIPIGYADGLNRHLGNGHAYCLVNGQRAPYAVSYTHLDVYKRQVYRRY